jgi:hypothetical protein
MVLPPNQVDVLKTGHHIVFRISYVFLLSSFMVFLGKEAEVIREEVIQDDCAGFFIPVAYRFLGKEGLVDSC